MSKQNNKRGAKAPLLGSKLKLFIEKLSIGGAGIARYEGLVFFVQNAAPLEEVIAEVTLIKKNFAEARVVEILKASPHRQTPPCAVASVCGGCNWQHISEDEQLRQKENLVKETLQKFNPEISFNFLPIEPSPRKFRYRNRIQPKFKNGVFGFFARHSHEIVGTEDCLITEEPLVEKFPEVKDWALSQNSKHLLKLEMYIAEGGRIEFGNVYDETDSVGFSQVNRFQNENLISTVIAWTSGQEYRNIYDLYAGSGNFTFPLSLEFPRSSLIGVELNPKLVKKAQSRISDKRIFFFESDVEKYLIHSEIDSDDLIIIDPPRAGASQRIMEILAKSGSKKIIYISCHPVSLARDIKWLNDECQKLGRKLSVKRIKPFEMFPQTDHIETIAELGVDT